MIRDPPIIPLVGNIISEFFLLKYKGIRILGFLSFNIEDFD